MKKIGIILLCGLLLSILGAGEARANFVSEQDARAVVQNWLEMTPTQSLAIEGTEVREVVYFTGGLHGNPGYYVVLLDPSGWVIVPV